MSLEGLRGVAAIFVVFHHISVWNKSFYDVEIIKNAYLMVDLFFVLSGFVIGRAYATRLETLRDVAQFQFLRFGRLYPTHFLFLMIFVFIEIAKYVAARKFNIASPNSEPFFENNPAAFLEQIFLAHAVIDTHNAMTFNFTSWSISTEFYVYLIFALFTIIAKNHKILVFSAICLLSVILLAIESPAGDYLMLRCVSGFFLGCLGAEFARGQKSASPAWMTIVSLAAMIAFLHFKSDARFDPAFEFISLTVILALAGGASGRVDSFFRSRLIAWLGTVSYSVYMSHGVVVWTAAQYFRLVLKKPLLVVDGRAIPQLSNVEMIIASVTVLLIVLGISQIVYRWVESPYRKRTRAIAARLFPKWTERNA
jgi:peptidoglycan/LPS O-acetylase OafA/YrhL